MTVVHTCSSSSNPGSSAAREGLGGVASSVVVEEVAGARVSEVEMGIGPTVEVLVAEVGAEVVHAVASTTNHRTTGGMDPLVYRMLPALAASR